MTSLVIPADFQASLAIMLDRQSRTGMITNMTNSEMIGDKPTIAIAI